VFGSPERTLVFDINDFDETLRGPWEWDVTRLAASMAIAGRNNGFNDVERRGVVLTAAAAYRSAVTEFAGMTNLGVWYARASVQAGLPRLRSMLDKKGLAQAQKAVNKAMSKDSAQALGRLTHLVDGERRIISDPPLVVLVEELATEREAASLAGEMHELINSHRRSLPRRPPAPARRVPVRPPGPQGRRCRQRRHPGVDRADDRSR
jgi:uncharacterized protein (DUF2252 family)